MKLNSFWLKIVGPYFFGFDGDGRFFKAVPGLGLEVPECLQVSKGLVVLFRFIKDDMYEAYSVFQFVDGISDSFRLSIMDLPENGPDALFIFGDPVCL